MSDILPKILITGATGKVIRLLQQNKNVELVTQQEQFPERMILLIISPKLPANNQRVWKILSKSIGLNLNIKNH